MLTNLTLSQYAETLSSHSPTPGGGSALANIALNAICLIEMSCNVTVKKLSKSNKPIPPQLARILTELAPLHDKAIQLIDNDAHCFDSILSAMRLPKDTEEQATIRSTTLQHSYVASANSCIELSDICLQAYLMADIAIQYSDKFVVSDAHIGKAIVKAVALANSYNIDVNIDCITSEMNKNKLIKTKQALLSQLA